MTKRLITDPQVFHRKLFNLTDIYSTVIQTNIHYLGVDCNAWIYRLRSHNIPNGTLLQIAQLMCKVESAELVAQRDGDLDINVIFEMPEPEPESEMPESETE